MAVLLFSLVGCRGSQEPAGADLLSELDGRISAGEYGEINSLLVWHEGDLLLESYYRGTTQGSISQVYSVTKSVTSAMVGEAFEEGYLTGLDDPLPDFFPQNEAINGRKEVITLEDLLTMRAGFVWNELSTIYGDEDNDVTQLTRSRDWTQYVIEREMAAEPGTQFTYNSGVTMLLGEILQQATGQTVEEYTKGHLFEPLEITQWRWQRTPTGESNTGWGLFLRPVDMVKFGQLYLQEGEWQGEQLLEPAWVTRSTAAVVQIDETYDYGYQWWRFADQNPIVADLTKNDVYFAWGFGGNFIFVVPHLDLVVVSTAENFENSAQFFPALSDYIFPAVQ